MSLTTDLFWIDRSNELVYVADDGSLEFLGPTRAYGFESRLSVELTRRLSFEGGLTKVLNAFYRGDFPADLRGPRPRISPPTPPSHWRAWRSWSGSLRMRAINHYRLDGEDASVRAAGQYRLGPEPGAAHPPRRGIQPGSR